MILGESADKTLHIRTLTHLDSEVFLEMSDKKILMYTLKDNCTRMLTVTLHIESK